MSQRQAARSPEPAAIADGPRGAGSLVDVAYGVPTPPRGYVERARLMRSLDHGAQMPLTLVSAAAGSGKTTLVSAWVLRRGLAESTAWMTFEPGAGTDVFWPEVFEAVRPYVGARLPRPPTDAGADHRALATLAAAIATRDTRLTLVLDGCEHAPAAAADGIDFLLRHNAGRLRVVLVTRTDPHLPLPRYRLDDTVHELRTADLAFTDREAQQLLAGCGLRIGVSSARALNTRARGWAAGLRFAAMSLAERVDPVGAIRDITGDSGDIADYLSSEVLDAQAPRMRDLLLNTCVVAELQPGLIEELGGRTAAHSLARLARANSFVECVVESPGRYRFHPFFAELLRAELAYASPRRHTRLHRKAAQWFASEGDLATAVSHATTVGGWREAAGFVVDDLAVGRLLTDGDSGLADDLRRIPAAISDPAAAVVRATLALARCDTETCARELSLSRAGADRGDAGRHRRVQLAAHVVGAVHACLAHDSEIAKVLVEEAEDELAAYPAEELDSHPELVALVETSKGVVLFRCGEINDARKALTAGASAAKAPYCEPLGLECVGYLSLIASLQGHLRRAREWANRAIAGADALRTPAVDRPPAARVALAWVSVEQLELTEAREHIRAALLSRTLRGDPVARVMLAIAQSRLRRAQGDVQGAITVLEKLREDPVATPGWLTDRLVIEAATLKLALGNRDSAVHDVETLGEPDDAASALVLAQARMDQDGHDPQDGQDPLDGLLTRVLAPDSPLQAMVAGRLLEVAESLRSGEYDRARVALDRSLRLAAPETLRRPFRDAPDDVRDLLEQESDRVGHARWLDGHNNGVHAAPNGRRAGSRGEWLPMSAAAKAGETLTTKELEVLGHLAELLTTEEIAAQMFVSVNTVRTHVRSILRKLAVSRRNEAVRRARELSLISV